MAADTGHDEKKVSLFDVGRLATLFAVAIELMQKGNRSAVMIQALFNAFQLFKENKLGHVVPMHESTKETPNIGEKENLWEPIVPPILPWDDTCTWAWTRVRQFLKNPLACSKNPEFLLAALFEYEHQPLHQCYWNNRFYLAIKFGMNGQKQEEAAWCAVSNGLNGYWEWETHSGYDMKALLRELGMPASEEIEGGYSHLDHEIARQIATKFNLPTTYFGNKTLSSGEEHRREKLNDIYPYNSVL